VCQASVDADDSLNSIRFCCCFAVLVLPINIFIYLFFMSKAALEWTHSTSSTEKSSSNLEKWWWFAFFVFVFWIIFFILLSLLEMKNLDWNIKKWKKQKFFLATKNRRHHRNLNIFFIFWKKRKLNSLSNFNLSREFYIFFCLTFLLCFVVRVLNSSRRYRNVKISKHFV
jgi:hypothetical protein